MEYLKKILKQVPGMRPASRFVRNQREVLALRRKTVEEIFTEICHRNKWGAKESVSGTGSDLLQTKAVRSALPVIWHDFAIHTMLDIPCGDFHWMKHVDLGEIDYIGADIVADLIERNRQYETSKIHFRKLNLIEDKLPRVDMIFCRDCLVHMSFKDAFTALQNICAAATGYLLTTTFTSRENNHEIATGQWRELNLEIAPFSFPPPLRIINEECSEGEAYKDKSLGLWKISDIRECLIRR